MKRKSVMLIIIILIAILAGKLIYEYKTSYTIQYKDFLAEITDVKNKEAITGIEMTASRKYPGTHLDIIVDDKQITKEQTIQMMRDVVDLYEEKVYSVQQRETLKFGTNRVYLYIVAGEDEPGRMKYVCRAEKDTKEMDSEGKTEIYWVLSIREDKDFEYIDGFVVDEIIHKDKWGE